MSEESRAESIFLAALKLPAQERTANVLAECGDDQKLRKRVDQLLAAQDKLGSFLQPAGGDATMEQTPPYAEGTTIGSYKLLHVIGEGRMGVVYMADQKKPVQRRVALKIIKPGMDSRQVVARFEAERQALAMMDHPNIAHVFDVGEHNDRPFIAMELVKGVPITQYCDEQKLSFKERLKLFVPVCHAVQHAHQKGVIHRDLKPTNVLVAEYDHHPVPKVIDFGVAKATGQQLTEKTMYTRFGQIVGTLEYMSPEQAKLNQLDIDTRSDVYSLGVLLYELLSGAPPFDRTRLQSAAFDEVLRIIREEEPPRPSIRISTLDTRASIAANRKAEPTQLGKQMRGELDWIVMKALEKDRNRRYETANGLAADLNRFLADETVEARAPTPLYRFRKFARRNRGLLAAGATVALIMLLATVISSIAAVYAIEQQTITVREKERAVEAEERAISAMEQLLQSYLSSRDYTNAQRIGPTLVDLLDERYGTAHDRTLDAMGQLADTYLKSEKGEKAILVCQRMRDASESNRAADKLAEAYGIAAWNTCVSADRSTEDFRQALERAKESIRLKAMPAATWVVLTAAHLRNGDPRAVDECPDDLLSLDGFGATLFLPAMAHHQLGNDELARAFFLAAHDGYHLTVVQGGWYEYEDWMPSIKRLRREAGDLLQIPDTEIWRETTSDDFSDAYSLLLERFPETVMFYERRARHLTKTERWDEVTSDLKKLVQLSPNSPQHLRNLGAWYLDRGERELYDKCCRQLLDDSAFSNNGARKRYAAGLCALVSDSSISEENLAELVAALNSRSDPYGKALGPLRQGDAKGATAALWLLQDDFSAMGNLIATLAYLQAGDRDAAKRRFAAATSQMTDTPGGPFDVWSPWNGGDLYNFATQQLLYREAKEKLGVENAP